MTNLLENGLKWLSGKQKKHVSSKVVYQVGDDTHEVNAVLGRTKYDTTDDYGLKISSHSVDFLIAHDELGLIPRVGHKIVYNGVVHEVLELGDECWRWCDPHGITRRIHTKQI